MDNNLGNVIKNDKARAVIYGAYVLIGLVIGGLQVAYASIEGTIQPDWLTVALSVYAYLGIPVGGLAAINSKIVPTSHEVTVERADVVQADVAKFEGSPN